MDELQPFQQRVVTEKAELDKKLTKLESFLASDNFVGIPDAEKDRLARQAKAMRQYSKVLNERIEAWA